MRSEQDSKNSKNAIRLTEIGPRLKLKLIKIQEGLQDGEVLYHFFMSKTPEELQKLRETLKLKKFVVIFADYTLFRFLENFAHLIGKLPKSLKQAERKQTKA